MISNSRTERRKADFLHSGDLRVAGERRYIYDETDVVRSFWRPTAFVPRGRRRRAFSDDLPFATQPQTVVRFHERSGSQDLVPREVDQTYSPPEHAKRPPDSSHSHTIHPDSSLEDHISAGERNRRLENVFVQLSIGSDVNQIISKSFLSRAVTWPADLRFRRPEPTLSRAQNSLLPLPKSRPSYAVSHKRVKDTALTRIRAKRSDDMAHAAFRPQGEARRYPSSSVSSGRYENRAPMNTVLCRNGPQCRKFQEGTCHYNHDFGSLAPNGLNATKKSLNVESPAFTPKSGNAQLAKNIGLSPKSVSAATFTPRGSGTVTPAAKVHSKESSAEFIPQQPLQSAQQFQEFVPGQAFIPSQHLDSQQQQLQSQLNAFSETFLAQQGLTHLEDSSAQLNPYLQQTSTVGSQPFFQDASSFKHPLNYHLYTSIGPKRENLLPYQRNTADFFIPDDLREELQRKSEATLQTFANSTLPQTVEHLHSLVALDTNAQKTQWMFGFPSSVYKATSSKDGHTYAIRRIEGFRLSDGAAIQTLHTWKRISSASVVQVHEAFTGRWFGDSSLILVTDYFPRSQTLAEKHFTLGRHTTRNAAQNVPEAELWSYIVQISGGLKAIHEGGLAAQTIVPSKVLITSKNRLRINGCGVFDILHYEQQRPVRELQRADLQDLGRLILGLAVRGQVTPQNVQKSLEAVSRMYSDRLRACLAWLITVPSAPAESAQSIDPSDEYNIHILLNNIADKIVASLDSTLQLEDELTSNLMRELENGRLARLVIKLNVILERPDTASTPNATTNPALLNQPSAAWSETGERYTLKLFRDYVFHQVDHEGRPVLDLGHIITCLNKLDAGIDEKIQLVSRDEQSVFIVSYKEVKRGFESAWAEINKASNPARR